MRYFHLIIRLSIFSLFFLSNHLFAAVYQWKFIDSNVNVAPHNNSYFDSPDLGCTHVSRAGHSYNGGYVTNGTFSKTKQSDTQFTCLVPIFNATTNAPGPTISLRIIRSGDSCPPDAAYDPQTGQCLTDPCKDKYGDPQSISKSGIKNDLFLKVVHSASLNKNFYITPPVACFQGCQVDIGDRVKCVVDIAGQYRCRGVGSFNGSSCSTDFPTTDPYPDGNDPVPQKRNSDEPCFYGTINGVTSCVTVKKYDSDGLFGDTIGNSNCSSTGGCNGVDPLSKDDRIKTDITSVTNPDGSITTTKTDTKTLTNCKSNNTNCTTSTTTKTSTTTTGANGNLISSGGTCQGDHCPGDTNPDGDGDGFGDCVGDDCGYEDESKVAGESCSADLSCDGDAIQCAILRQEKENNCKWSLGTEEQAAVTAAVSGEGFELEETNINTSTIFSEALAQGRWLSASCPTPRTLSVMGKTLSFSWQPVCDFAIAIGPIIVAMASLFFALFVFRGVKGS